MKQLSFASVVISLLFCLQGCSARFQQQLHYCKEKIIVNMVLCKAAEQLEQEYHIKLAGGLVAAAPDGIIEKFNLNFDITGPISKEHLRKTLVFCALKLLQTINSRNEIQPYLTRTPFKFENLQLILIVSDKTKNPLLDPNISVAELSRGFLTYKTRDPHYPDTYLNTFTETCDDALAILHLKNPSPDQNAQETKVESHDQSHSGECCQGFWS